MGELFSPIYNYTNFFKILIRKGERRCGGMGTWPCRSKKYISPHPLVNKLSRHILALCGGAAIFHDLLTQGCGLYFFFSPAGAKPANRFGGERKHDEKGQRK